MRFLQIIQKEETIKAENGYILRVYFGLIIEKKINHHLKCSWREHNRESFGPGHLVGVFLGGLASPSPLYFISLLYSFFVSRCI